MALQPRRPAAPLALPGADPQGPPPGLSYRGRGQPHRRGNGQDARGGEVRQGAPGPWPQGRHPQPRLQEQGPPVLEEGLVRHSTRRSPRRGWSATAARSSSTASRLATSRTCSPATCPGSSSSWTRTGSRRGPMRSRSSAATRWSLTTASSTSRSRAGSTSSLSTRPTPSGTATCCRGASFASP